MKQGGRFDPTCRPSRASRWKIVQNAQGVLWIGTPTGDAPSRWRMEATSNAPEALDLAKACAPAVVVISCPLAEGSTDELIEPVKRVVGWAPILVADESASVADAARYVRLGVHDVIAPGADIWAAIEKAARCPRPVR